MKVKRSKKKKSSMTSQSIGKRDQKDIDSSQTIEVKLEEGEKEKT